MAPGIGEGLQRGRRLVCPEKPSFGWSRPENGLPFPCPGGPAIAKPPPCHKGRPKVPDDQPRPRRDEARARRVHRPAAPALCAAWPASSRRSITSGASSSIPSAPPSTPMARAPTGSRGDGDAPVGRISAQIDHLATGPRHDGVGFFGCLDAIDDGDVVAALLRTGRGLARRQGQDDDARPVPPVDQWRERAPDRGPGAAGHGADALASRLSATSSRGSRILSRQDIELLCLRERRVETCASASTVSGSSGGVPASSSAPWTWRGSRPMPSSAGACSTPPGPRTGGSFRSPRSRWRP